MMLICGLGGGGFVVLVDNLRVLGLGFFFLKKGLVRRLEGSSDGL